MAERTAFLWLAARLHLESFQTGRTECRITKKEKKGWGAGGGGVKTLLKKLARKVGKNLTGYLNSVEDGRDHWNSAQNPSALISISSPAWVNSTMCAYKSSN